MGLLERALQYKQKINDTGKQTLIDKIKGPAETDSVMSTQAIKVDVKEIDQIEDVMLETPRADKIVQEVFESDNSGEPLIKETEEDIIIFDDSDFISSEHTGTLEGLHGKDDSTEDVLDRKPIKSDVVDDKIEEIADVVSKQNDDKNVADDSFSIPEFNDYGILFEIQNEFIKADSVEDVYSTILFSIMGQLGVSSVSIVAPSIEDPEKWIITDSHGIKISDTDLFWKLDDGILQILNNYKGVLDIEEIKNDINLRDDYYKFTAVDARIITPLIKDGVLAGVILVGEKINSEEFTPVEIEFLHVLSEIGSSIIESLFKHEKTSTELLGLRIEKEILLDVESFQDSILNVSSLIELKEIIQKNFYSLGIENYALFMKEKTDGDYYPAYFDPEDLLGFSNSGFKIKRDNRLISFLINKKSSIILENFTESSVIIDTFGRSRIVKMELFIAYPFIISGKLSGFITIFKINPAVDIVDIDIRIQKINRFLFPYINRVYELDPEMNRYDDLSDIFYHRIENEIKQARDLNIPLSLIQLTIKNYKRFYERFGNIELDKLSSVSSEIIKTKLSEGDFFAKIDRNKFLLVLPGKEKRYSIMLSNSIKNEITERFDMSDFKLLITSMNSVFPEDGKDIFSILEVLE